MSRSRHGGWSRNADQPLARSLAASPLLAVVRTNLDLVACSGPRRQSMDRLATATPLHPVFSRRIALQAGAIGLLGLGINHLAPLRALAAPAKRRFRARSVIYIFLS